jgi:geranylgeranyl diphosphate synthase type II
MGNELFEEVHQDAYAVAMAIELFHNFTLIHDDIMDKAPLRRGKATVHEKYGSSTALLAGDVMLVAAYECLAGISAQHLKPVLQLFNKTAREVCEGQQFDMDFEQLASVQLDEYIQMIEKKTSVLLAASLQMGAILGGAGLSNQQKLYEFGRNLGIAFQIQDDYLDAFGDPGKFGKQVGGDIRSNKKTFLLIRAMEVAEGEDAVSLQQMLQSNAADKVESVLKVFKRCGVDEWAVALKDRYLDAAMSALDEIAVVSVRKKPLLQLAEFLVKRDH